MSGGKISFNASGMNFDIKTFNDYSDFKALDNYGFNNANYEEPDYSNTLNVEAKEQVLDKTDFLKEEVKVEEKNIVNGDFLEDKFVNVTAWAATKNIFKDSVEALTGSSFCTTPKGMIIIALLEGTYKSGLKGLVTGDCFTSSTFASGFSKSILSSGLKENIKLTSLKGILDTKAFKEIGSEFDTIFEEKGFFEKTIQKIGNKEFNKQYKDIINPIKLSNFKNIAGNIGMGIGIEYVASMGANLVSALVKGDDIDVKSMKPGQTFLRSSTKMICATAGELIGGKKGKLIGTVVGATIAEFQVAGFTEVDEDGNKVVNEKWCAIAGGAEIAGAVVGAAAVVFFVSNPAGWVIGAAVLVGAAVGYGITCLIYNWDNVCNWAEETWNSTIDAVSDSFEYVGNKIEEGIDTAVEYIDEKIDDAKEWVEDKVKANPVTNFLVGWAF